MIIWHLGHVEKLISILDNKGIKDIPNEALILGFTFKENCPDIRNTKVMNLIDSLQEKHIKPCVVDPCANKEDAFKEYKIEILNKLPFERKKFQLLLL